MQDDFDYEAHQEDLPEILDERSRLLADLEILKMERKRSWDKMMHGKRLIHEARQELVNFKERVKATNLRRLEIQNRIAEIKANQRRARNFHDARVLREERMRAEPVFIMAARQFLGMEDFKKVWEIVKEIGADRKHQSESTNGTGKIAGE